MLFQGIISLSLSVVAFSGQGRAPPMVGPEVRPQPTAADVQRAPSAATFSIFMPHEFPFVTIIPDDGVSPSGWQRAKVNLRFTRILLPVTVINWYCPFTIEMPMRTAAHGAISLVRAAIMSAAVANAVDATIDHKLPQGIFCERFRDGMKATFPSTYPNLGARINR